MTSRASPRSFLCRGAALVLVSAGFIAGCEEKKKPPPPPPPPPPAPKLPEKIEVQALLQELNSDARIQFPAENAPTERALAEGVIQLSNALAKGDAGSLRSMLDRAGQSVLDELVGNGGWEEATQKIEAVRIVRLRQNGYERPTATVATAIQEPDGAYVLVWNAEPRDEGYIFSPRLAADGIKPRASEWDSAEVTGSLGSIGSGHEAGSEGQNPGEEAPAEEEQEERRDPMRRNTPSGPITIPNPGGGGGGGGG